ncbi:unnamed protein product [Adineta ricciae]|uniref:Uncharacterized protein n=1 Tax=Adineta ricciae TaxID=249248 RepID=A0A814X680_ADIRI|nr:unnamed protein product [Adineta ricciae]CAF1213608.1 unnamed protein product [Adineta ricciae]
MTSPVINRQKALSTESLNIRSETSQQRISLQHIFNSCVLDKNQRVNAGELIRHFRFVTEQNSDFLTNQLDFAFLLNQLGGSDQQVTFDQLFNAVEKLYSELVEKSSISTPVSKSISSMSLNSSSSSKKRRNKENIESHTSDDASSNSFDLRRKSIDHEKCRVDYNELMEVHRRQTECLHMLEDEYKKLDDDHHRLQIQYEDMQKKKLSLEDELNRSTRYANENVDLHMYKTQLETSNRVLKEENESCERERFELQEQLIDIEHQLQIIRDERNQCVNKLSEVECEWKKERNEKEKLEEQMKVIQNQLKENNEVIHSLRKTIDDLNVENQTTMRKNENLEKNLEELRQQLRNAKMESIEARLSLSNLCEEESFLCDELEERVDVSRRVTISNGQSLFAEINTMDNISNECVSQCLDSSNMETIDDMEVQILLSKSDSFNSIHLKDVFHELHVNGMTINEHLTILNEKIQCEQDRESISTTSTLIEKHLSIIKNLIKKIIDNKDVFEGRFRKLQTLLIASRHKQQKFQIELNEISQSSQTNVTSSNVISTLKEYHETIEELKVKEQLFDEKIRLLEEQLFKLQGDEKAQRLKCHFLTKQVQKMTSKAKEKQEQFDENGMLTHRKNHPQQSVSNLTNGVCPYHSVRELLREDGELFNSASASLPCRCLNRSRSSPELNQMDSPSKHIRRLSSPCGAAITTSDSGLNSSTNCTTSRSPTPELNEDISSMALEFDSLFNRTLTKEDAVSKTTEKKSNRSATVKNVRPTRVKRVLKRLQWCTIITSCSIVLFLWSVIIRYYCLTSPNDDDCSRLSFAWWPFAYCSPNGITL